jgi:chromosome partitioning protein
MLTSMRVVVVTSQKGGSGKTTLSGHIAVEAERKGFAPVALVDADPQGSLASWWNARAADTPAFAKTEVSRLHNDLQALRQAGMRLVVIDTPPAVTGTIRNVVAFADLVVIPTRPSPHDLRAVAATIDIVEAKDKPFVFVVNGATPRARISADAAIALSQHGTVAPVTIHHRTDFASSMIDGRTVMECEPGGKSAVEIEELWVYLAQRLAKLEPRASYIPVPVERPSFGRHDVELASHESEPAEPASAEPVVQHFAPATEPAHERPAQAAVPEPEPAVPEAIEEIDVGFGRPVPEPARPPQSQPQPQHGERQGFGRREQPPGGGGFGRRVAHPGS